MKIYKKKSKISVHLLEKIYFLKHIRDFSTIFIKKLLIFGKFWYIFYFLDIFVHILIKILKKLQNFQNN